MKPSRSLVLSSRVILTLAMVAVAPPLLGTRASAQIQRQEGDAPRFEVDPFWPKPLPNNWYPGAVSSVAIDSHDHIWIIHRPRTLEPRERGLELKKSQCCIPAPPVLEFDPAGNLLQGWGGPSPDSAWLGKTGSEHGIYVDDNDNVWISEANGDGNVVLKFTRTGKFLIQIGELGKTGGSNDQKLLGAPSNVTVDITANEVYIADGYKNRRIIVFDASTGAYKRHWGAYGNRPDDAPQGPYDPSTSPRRQFSTPVHCVRIARDGSVYVCDRSNNRIQVFRKDGAFVTELIFEKETRDLGPLCDVAFSPDASQRFLYIADCANDKVHIVSRKDLKIVDAFGQKGRHAGELYGPHFLVVDSKGNIYIAEVFGRRLQKFDYKGLPTVTRE